MVFISHILSTDLSKPDEGVRQGDLNSRGEADIVPNHHLIHGLNLKHAAVNLTVSSINALKVPTLEGAEGVCYKVILSI